MLLNKWKQMSPEDAMELLDYQYADISVRNFAVRCLEVLRYVHMCAYECMQCLWYVSPESGQFPVKTALCPINFIFVWTKYLVKKYALASCPNCWRFPPNKKRVVAVKDRAGTNLHQLSHASVRWSGRSMPTEHASIVWVLWTLDCGAEACTCRYSVNKRNL